MRNLHQYFILLVILLQFNSVWAQDVQGVKDDPFVQEYHIAYSLGDDAAMNDVRCIMVDQKGKVWAGTKAGLFLLNKESSKWEAMLDSANQDPVTDIFEDSNGTVWVTMWNGLYKADNYKVVSAGVTNLPLAVISENDGMLRVFDIKSIWDKNGNHWERSDIPYSLIMRDLIPDSGTRFYLAIGKGLYHIEKDKATLFQNEKELLSDNLFGLDFSVDGEL